MHRLLLLSLLAAVFLSPLCAVQPLRIGRVAYNSPRQVLVSHYPLIQWLKTKPGLENLELLLFSCYETLDKKLRAKEVEIGWLGSVYYAEQVMPPYKAFLAPVWRGNSHYSGQILVHRDSPFTDLLQLRGHSIAFVNRNSSSGYTFPRLLLEQAGVRMSDFSDVQFLGKHDSVAFALIARQFDAGAVYAGVLEREGLREQAIQLRVLAQTESIPNEPLVVRSDVASEAVQILQTSLTSQEANDYFTAIHGLTGFHIVSDSDYNSVRKLVTP